MNTTEYIVAELPQFDAVTLTNTLAELESKAQGFVTDVQDERATLVLTAAAYHESFFIFGAALDAYRKATPFGMWLPVVQAIANSLGTGDRTIRNLYGRYKKAVGLDADVLAGLKERNIDPVARKNEALLDALIDGDQSISADEQIVAALQKGGPRKTCSTSKAEGRGNQDSSADFQCPREYP